jgi:serine/threonine-protein kinase
VACSTLNLAAVLKDKQAFEESEPLLRMALPVLEQENPDAFAACLNNLAGILEKTGRPEEARRLYERALVIRRSYWGADHPEVATTLNNFGLFLLSRREYPGAELLLREGVAIRRDRLSKDDPLLATSLNNLGYLLACKGDHAGAVPWFREALAIRRRMLGSCRETVEAVVNLALQLAELKEWNEAELLLKEAVEWCRARGLNEEYWLNLRRLVRLTMLANRLPAALEAARDLVRFCRDRRPVVARELGQALNYLGRILTRHGNPREAEPLLEEGLRLLHEGDSIDSLLARVSLGACKSELGRHAEAEELLLEALRIVRGLKNADDRPEAAVARELVRLYERWNKPERAAEYRSLAERSTGPEPRGRTK